MKIRAVESDDIDNILQIYNYHVQNTIVTFEEKLVTKEIMSQRISEVLTLNYPCLVSEFQGKVIGYAYANYWKSRSAYRFSAESTIYLDQNFVKMGFGTKLYSELFKILKEKNINIVIGGISLPNEASVYLHEKLGFKKVGHFEKIGFKLNQWIDVGYWQKNL